MTLTKATVAGLVKIEEQPTQNHYHEGRAYHSVKVSSQRNADASKVDYLRLYFSYDSNQDFKNVFKPGNYIRFSGSVVKSKITESLSDIAVSLDSATLVPKEELDKMIEVHSYVKSGSVINMTGEIIKVGKEIISNNIKSVSILVMEEDENGYKVIVKFTGVGDAAEKISKMSKGDLVKILAKVYSYKIKNRIDLDNYYLHDSRISSITKIVDKSGSDGPKSELDEKGEVNE